MPARLTGSGYSASPSTLVEMTMPHDDDTPQEHKGWPKPGEDGERLERQLRKSMEEQELDRQLRDAMKRPKR
jgi:hypothetical protein